MLTKLVGDIVKKLVDKPEAVIVLEIPMADKLLIQVRVAAHDLGRVIGSEGRTFRALRTLVNLVDPTRAKDLVVDIVE
jgi:uncharacterized protein